MAYFFIRAKKNGELAIEEFATYLEALKHIKDFGIPVHYWKTKIIQGEKIIDIPNELTPTIMELEANEKIKTEIPQTESPTKETPKETKKRGK